MTAPVGLNTVTNLQQPVGAYTLNGSSRFEPGSFVVNPPSQFYKYSIYDELKLGEDKFKEIISNLQDGTARKNIKRDKRKKLLSKMINWGIVIGSGILLYKYRTQLKGFVSQTFDALKRMFKK